MPTELALGNHPTRGPGTITGSTVGVPRSLLRRLWYALAGAALFVGVATVEGALRPDYDAWHQAISALSLGARGWVQQINFVLLGAVLLSTVPTWRQILTGGKGANAYPALTAVVALSFIAVAFLPQDPAPGYDPAGLGLVKPTTIGLLHLAVAGVAAACSVAALFVMAARSRAIHTGEAGRCTPGPWP